VGIIRMTQQTEHGRIYSLANAEPGDRVQVMDVSADKLLKKRLVSMGILTNSFLHVLQRRGSAIVIGFDASRIAIGAGMSQHILVRAV
jgi:Fe2+ transport system protein FeoA